MSSDETLTMIPGPTPVQAEILEALALPTTSHQAPSFVEAYDACLRSLKRIVFTETGYPFVVAGAGTLAMEMALVNLVAPDERVLVVSQGYFGDRWAQLARSFGLPHRLLQAEWGQVVSPEQVERELAGGSFCALAMTHVDTSTGAAAPVEAYCRLLRDRPTLALLDGVCATAGVEQRFDDWGLDALVTGAQKALGAPPGVAILVASARAMAKRETRESVPAYYADLLRWRPIMDNPALYFSTPPVNEILALNAATRIVLDEGLESRFRRHERIAAALRAGLGALGLKVFTDPECRADTLSVVLLPEAIDDAAFRAEMAARKVIVAGGLGPLAGRVCRIGHMGNIGASEVRRTLTAVAESLSALGRSVDPQDATEAALRHLEAV